jgi:hypothetical protein
MVGATVQPGWTPRSSMAGSGQVVLETGLVCFEHLPADHLFEFGHVHLTTGLVAGIARPALSQHLQVVLQGMGDAHQAGDGVGGKRGYRARGWSRWRGRYSRRSVRSTPCWRHGRIGNRELDRE